jgi:fructan beta-fructosidase
MFSYPVTEITSIYEKEFIWEDTVLKSGQNILANLQKDNLDMEIEFEYDHNSNLNLIINGRDILYDAQKKALLSGDMMVPLKPLNGKIHLRILADMGITEIFGNKGRVYMPLQALPEDNNRSIEMYNTDEELKINVLKVRVLKSIWNK